MSLEISIKGLVRGTDFEPKDTRLGSALSLSGASLETEVILEAIKTLKPTKEDAPNIDITSPFEVLHWIGTEALWKTLNGVPLDKSPDGKMVTIPITEVYSLKRAVSDVFYGEK